MWLFEINFWNQVHHLCPSKQNNLLVGRSKCYPLKVSSFWHLFNLMNACTNGTGYDVLVSFIWLCFSVCHLNLLCLVWLAVIANILHWVWQHCLLTAVWWVWTMLIDVRWWLLEGGLSVHTSQQLSFVLSDQQDSYQTILACLNSLPILGCCILLAESVCFVLLRLDSLPYHMHSSVIGRRGKVTFYLAMAHVNR